eukprot:1191271-Amphidinium_carterae.1
MCIRDSSSVQTVLLDKTGTITTGAFTVSDWVVPEDGGLRVMSLSDAQLSAPSAPLRHLWECAWLNTDGQRLQKGEVRTPLNTALAAASGPGLGEDGTTDLTQHVQVFQIPFNSSNKWMLSIHKDGCSASAVHRVIIKGMLDRILPFCQLEEEQLAELSRVSASLTMHGKKLMCFIEARLTDYPDGFQFRGSSQADLNFELGSCQFIGLVAMEDPPRPYVAEALSTMTRAGLRTVMVTGDMESTAIGIARRIGMLESSAEAAGD